ncbi:SprT family zinc-dependent metalloprotease [Sulfurimonas sp.]|uniref:M48 family metallopeptidase n=1 Tax=Sulfurimonas sp. TaxID=2022749 RepID=UPI0025D8D042|nr:SprT family zinc-dependent metalloprotease [Sulfurimonas sp.]MBW6487587.1 M48 family metallopeptidase [Sulfurimonas sp.]
MSISKISFNDLEILHVRNRALKNSYISVKRNGLITVKTSNVSEDYVRNLLEKKELWIRKQLQKIQNNPQPQINMEDEVLLFGEILSIDIDEAKELRKELERVDVLNAEAVLKCYDKFYKNYAKNYLIPRVEHYSRIMELDFSEIKFRKMRSRWGSCSSMGVITLNIELIKIDKKLIDFIVVHELSHLVHMNHSKKFHSLVERYLPDAKSLNRELKAIRLF